MYKKLLGIIHLSDEKDTNFPLSRCYNDSQISLFSPSVEKTGVRLQFQGKLYNQDTLKELLSIKELSSDHTIILKAYKKWGIDLLSKLDGIYAFALWDTQTQKLYLAKDRVSVQPLYYYHDMQSFLFGSSLRTMTTFAQFHKALDTSALSNYFTYGYIMQPNTIYKNCHKIKSAHYLCYDIEAQTYHETKYWDLGDAYDKEKLSLSIEEFTQESHRLLKASIQKRVQGVSHPAASLSGGYDSSTIAALLQEKHSQKIKTFTMGFEDESINEAPEAKAIAKHLGTEHHEHYFSAQDALHIVPKLSEVYDEPFYDNGSIPTTLLSSILQEEGVETIFAGDGGDEVFATADDIERFDRILSVPKPLRNTIFHLLNTLNPSKIPYLSSYQNFPTKYYKFTHFIKADTIPDMVKVKMTLFHPYEIQQLIQDSDTKFASIFDDIHFGEHAQSVDKVIGSYFKTFMTDGELNKTIGAFSYQNISVREPYLDIDLVEFMARVPSEIKIQGGNKKHLLKQIAYQHIPKPLLDRPKKGFSIPFSQWMKHELKPLVMETLSYENIKKDNILLPKYVLEIKNNFYAGKEEYKYKLWSILLYQLWYEKNMRD